MSTGVLRLVEHLSAEDRRRLNKIARREARVEIVQQLTAMEQAVEEERERRCREYEEYEDYDREIWYADDAREVFERDTQEAHEDVYQPVFYDDD